MRLTYPFYKKNIIIIPLFYRNKMTLSTTIKRTLFSFGLGIGMLTSSASFAQDSHGHKDGRTCSTDHNLERLLSINPEAKQTMRNIETFTQDYIKNTENQGSDQKVGD